MPLHFLWPWGAPWRFWVAAELLVWWICWLWFHSLTLCWFYCSVGFCRASWPLLAKEAEFSFSMQELMLSFLICPSFGVGLWLTAQQQVDIDWPVSISWLERSEESFKLNSCGHTRLIISDRSLESLTLFHTLACKKTLKRYPRVWIILRH